MKRITVITGLILNLILLFAVSPVVAGEARISFGSLDIHPGITLEGIYDDNIYLDSGKGDSEDEEQDSDIITHIKPGLNLAYGLVERGSINCGYTGDFAYYSDYDENDWKAHEFFAGADYAAPGGLILDIKDTYRNTEDPYGSYSEYKLGEAGTQRWINRVNAKVGYDFQNRLKLFTYYNFTKQEYYLREDFAQDYESDEIGVGVQMKVLTKTWAFIRYHWGERDYCTHINFVTDDNDADFSTRRVNTGITWDSGAQFDGEINFGYQWKEYDNDRDPSGLEYDDENTWIASTGIKYAMTPNTTFSLTISRSVMDAGGDTNEYYENTGIRLGIQQLIFGELTMRADCGYGTDEYNMPVTRKKDQDTYRAGLGIEYPIQDWLKAEVAYSYLNRNSNYSEDEFIRNMYTITLSAAY